MLKPAHQNTSQNLHHTHPKISTYIIGRGKEGTGDWENRRIEQRNGWEEEERRKGRGIEDGKGLEERIREE